MMNNKRRIFKNKFCLICVKIEFEYYNKIKNSKENMRKNILSINSIISKLRTYRLSQDLLKIIVNILRTHLIVILGSVYNIFNI